MIKRISTITFEITRKCPNQCLHCSTLSSPCARDFLLTSDVLRTIDEARGLGLQTVILSGGEPLVYPNLSELINALLSRGLEVIIYTSGSYAPEACTDLYAFLQRLSGRRVRFNLSVHSHLAETHDRFMCVQGSWNRAMAFLANATALRLEVQVHCVVTKMNFSQIAALGKLVSLNGATKLRLLRLVPQGRALQNQSVLELNEIEWAEVKMQVEEFISPLQSFALVLGAHLAKFGLASGYECSLDKGKLTIEPDGSVAVCPALKGAKSILGSPNIHLDSLANILNGEWRQRISNLKTQGSPTECPAQNLYIDKLLRRAGQ